MWSVIYGKTAAPQLGYGHGDHLKHLERRYRRQSLKGIESIGVDELAVRSGHVYNTIVADMKQRTTPR